MPLMKKVWVRGVMPERSMVTPGVWPARSRAVIRFCVAMASTPTTVTATGVFCSRVDCRVAVTITSCTPGVPASAGAAAAIAIGVAAASVAGSVWP